MSMGFDFYESSLRDPPPLWGILLIIHTAFNRRGEILLLGFLALLPVSSCFLLVGLVFPGIRPVCVYTHLIRTGSVVAP